MIKTDEILLKINRYEFSSAFIDQRLPNMIQRFFADVIHDAIWLMNMHEQKYPWFLALIHNTIEMEKPRCNFDLGNNRFVQATELQEQMRIDVQEWNSHNGRKIPTKKGISLPLHRWKMLVNSFEFLDQALDEKKD